MGSGVQGYLQPPQPQPHSRSALPSPRGDVGSETPRSSSRRLDLLSGSDFLQDHSSSEGRVFSGQHRQQQQHQHHHQQHQQQQQQQHYSDTPSSLNLQLPRPASANDVYNSSVQHYQGSDVLSGHSHRPLGLADLQPAPARTPMTNAVHQNSGSAISDVSSSHRMNSARSSSTSETSSSGGGRIDTRPMSRDGASASRVGGRSALVLTALEDLRRAASSATAAVAVATGSSSNRDAKAPEISSFSPTGHAASGSSSGKGLMMSGSGSSDAGRSAAPSSGFSAGFGGSSAHGMSGSDASRGRRSVSFSEQAQVQQFHNDEFLPVERHQNRQQQQQQQQQNQNMFAIPEPPPRKR
jgi:hypothetical protein